MTALLDKMLTIEEHIRPSPLDIKYAMPSFSIFQDYFKSIKEKRVVRDVSRNSELRVPDPKNDLYTRKQSASKNTLPNQQYQPRSKTFLDNLFQIDDKDR